MKKINSKKIDEEKIDTRVKIHGQPLRLKEATPVKLDEAENKMVGVTIKTNQADKSVKNNIVTKVKQESKQSTKVKVRDIAAVVNNNKTDFEKKPADNYSPAILSDTLNDNSKSQSSIILIVILTVIVIILVGFIISWYYQQYGDSSISRSATKVLSASEENFDYQAIPITEISQKLSELNAITQDLDQEELTPEPTIKLNIKE